MTVGAERRHPTLVASRDAFGSVARPTSFRQFWPRLCALECGSPAANQQFHSSATLMPTPKTSPGSGTGSCCSWPWPPIQTCPDEFQQRLGYGRLYGRRMSDNGRGAAEQWIKAFREQHLLSLLEEAIR